eukprot:scaffold212_cov404-Prasinococcus_capsulatus_cf.AAC.12
MCNVPATVARERRPEVAPWHGPPGPHHSRRHPGDLPWRSFSGLGGLLWGPVLVPRAAQSALLPGGAQGGDCLVIREHPTRPATRVEAARHLRAGGVASRPTPPPGPPTYLKGAPVALACVDGQKWLGACTARLLKARGRAGYPQAHHTWKSSSTGFPPRIPLKGRR